MFWIWIRRGPFAVLALIGVILAFIALFLIGSHFAPWVTPVLVVTFFAVLLYALWLIDPRRRPEPPADGDGPGP